MDFGVLWFLLLGVLLAGYAILDGFDLGVGILHLFAKGDRERRILVNSIGPIWDGNEVWLVTFGGALFAAFPEAYATIFSGFYTLFMILLLCLITRAVSLEFRGKSRAPRWRIAWDWAFFAASGLASFLFGAAIGTTLIGFPLDERGIIRTSTLDLVFPSTLPWFPAAVGSMTVALFALHGALFLHFKTEGELQRRARSWVWHAFGSFLVLYLAVTIGALVFVPRATAGFEHRPWAWAVVALTVLALANVPRAIFAGRYAQAFLSSSTLILALVGLVGVALFPEMVPARDLGPHGLTLVEAASSVSTLKIMTLIAAIGMPFVVGYTAAIYWAFRGKVKLDEHAY